MYNIIIKKAFFKKNKKKVKEGRMHRSFPTTMTTGISPVRDGRLIQVSANVVDEHHRQMYHSKTPSFSIHNRKEVPNTQDYQNTLNIVFICISSEKWVIRSTPHI